MRLVEAKFDLTKVSSRVENVFNSIPSSITAGKTKTKGQGKNNIQNKQPIVTKLSKIQEKNARRKAMKNGGLLADKKIRSSYTLDEKSLFFQSINCKIQKIRKLSDENKTEKGPEYKKAKIV